MCKSKISSVQFDLSVHFKCAYKILNLYLKEIVTKYSNSKAFCPVSGRNSLGLKFDCRQNANGH